MEEPESYKALSAGDEPSGIIKWQECHSCATHALARGGQLPEKDTRGSSVAGVLRSSG